MFTDCIIVTGNVRHNNNVNRNVNHKQDLLKQYYYSLQFFLYNGNVMGNMLYTKSYKCFSPLLTPGFKPYEKGIYQNYVSRFYYVKQTCFLSFIGPKYELLFKIMFRA